MKTLDEMCEYSFSHWQDTLFRYQPPKVEYLRQTLLDSTLHLSAPSAFDDQCDCKITINSTTPRILRFLYLRKIVRKRNPSWRPHQVQREIIRLLQHIESQAQDEIDSSIVTETIGVLCLTGRIDNMHLWENFADGHTGVCLVFSTKGDEPPLFPIFKVYYEDTLPTLNPFSPDMEHQLLEIFITKKTEYDKEEWRMWEEELGPGDHPFNPEQLEGLIFGAKASDDFIAKIIAINRKRTPPIFLGRAVIEKNGESIDIVRL